MLGDSEVGDANFNGGGRGLLLWMPCLLGEDVSKDDEVEEVGGVSLDC